MSKTYEVKTIKGQPVMTGSQKEFDSWWSKNRRHFSSWSVEADTRSRKVFVIDRAPTPTKTQIGAHLVWYCPQRQQLRQSDATGQGDLEFEVEAFSRPELAQAHQIFMQAQA